VGSKSGSSALVISLVVVVVVVVWSLRVQVRAASDHLEHDRRDPGGDVDNWRENERHLRQGMDCWP